MLSKLAAAGLALFAGLVLAAPVSAEDTLRLNLADPSAPTLNLKATEADLEADAIETFHKRYYGGFYGGYGYRRGYAAGGFGYGYGYGRGYAYGGYRYGYSRGYAYGGYRYGYRPYYPVYRSYGYGYGYAYRRGYCPIAITEVEIVTPRLLVLNCKPESAAPVPEQYDALPAPTPLPAPEASKPNVEQLPNLEQGTFPYDGGPTSPIPMPTPQRKPTLAPNDSEGLIPMPTPQRKPALVPYDSVGGTEHFVSLPAAEAPVTPNKTGKWVYPAYGEKARRSR